MSETTNLPFDPWELDHLEARQRIRELPDDADFAALLEREQAREKGPRPTIVRALQGRMGGDAAEAPTEAPSGGLDEAGWTESTWAGHRLYRCRHCPAQSFDVGEMFDHVQRAHPSGKE